jgi:hypothetical protein
MSKTIINFLLGTESIDGYWFEDVIKDRKPFWWRFHLRQYEEARDKEIKGLKEQIAELEEEVKTLSQFDER